MNFEKKIYSKSKYKIVEQRTGREVYGAFILFPEQEQASRVAMSAYAGATKNHKIRAWIKTWLQRIERHRTRHRN